MRMRSQLSKIALRFAALALATALPLAAEDHAALGREALAKADYAAAAEHLAAASRELEGGDREKLSAVQMDLGIAYLAGLSRPADALRAFVRSADLTANPASAWLWASTAAAQLGDETEAARYRSLALGGKAAPPVATKPVVEPEPASTPEPVEEPESSPESMPIAEPKPAPKPDPAATSEPPAKLEPAVKAEKPAEAKAPEETPAGSAFDHFFKRKPSGEPENPPATEPPPA